MSKGRIITQAILTRLSLSAAALLLCVPTAHAQQGNPEVYIDMGVLQGVGNTPAAPAPIKLRPPAPKPAYEQGLSPRLTAPVAAPPPEQVPVPAPEQKQMNVQPARPQPAPIAAPAPKPVVKKQVEPAPVRTPAAPKTIKPETVSKSPEMPPDTLPLKSAPAMPVAEAVKPALLPAPVSPVVAEPSPAVMIAPEPEPIIAPPTATVFPVETRVREETNDPTDSESSRPVPVRSGITGNLQDTVVPSRPLQDMDPAGSAPTPVAAPVVAPVLDDLPEPDKVAAPAPEAKTALTAKAPPLVPAHKPQTATSKVVTTAPKVRIDAVREEAVPPADMTAVETTPKANVKTAVPPLVPARRPNFVEKAPAELVAELRAREAVRAVEEIAKASGNDAKNKRKIDLSDPPPPPGPRGQKNMPAVKKTAVESESIAEQVVKLPAHNDPLLDSLVEKDKESLVATIESMVAAREDGKTLPAAAKPKREIGSNIVKAEPMQRPYNVYRPNKTTEEETKVASLPPAGPAVTPDKPAAVAPVSNGPRPPQPQAQDEQAYVSVPFSEGLTEIDTKISGEIEKRILPILNQNPAWKLQIQAFASPVKDGASSARKASLARALSVRTYLLGKGIDATRMDVRALGAESDRDPMDRVDLIIFDPAKRG